MQKLLPLAALLVFGLSGGMAQAVDEGTKQTFNFYCAQCHGTGGKGDGPNVTDDFPVNPRNFTKKDEMNKLTNADIKNVILKGGPVASKSPMMPPWGKTLSAEEIDSLVVYLRELCQCEGKQE
ncbi:MAG: cytochrome c [Gammaproteobacteria bacterium]|nr:cytochrome c [Gammaproteobacteria bacterium]